MAEDSLDATLDISKTELEKLETILSEGPEIVDVYDGFYSFVFHFLLVLVFGFIFGVLFEPVTKPLLEQPPNSSLLFVYFICLLLFLYFIFIKSRQYTHRQLR